MGRLYACLLLCSNLLGTTVCAQGAGSIVAVVNDKVISKRDFDHRINMALLSSGGEASEAQKKEIGEHILRLMIDEILERELGKKFKIDISDMDIDRSIEVLEAQNGMPKGGLQKLLESKNIPMRIMREHLKARQTWQEYIKAKYSDTIQVSDQEVQTFLEKIKKQKDAEHFLLSEIYLPFGSGTSEEQTRQYAHVLREKIRKGAPFAAIAQEFSQLANGSRGGDMGWITLQSLDETRARALKGLKPGEVSEPIRVEGGYYLLLLKDRQSHGRDLGKDTLLSFQQALFPASPQGPQEQLQQVYQKAQSIAHQAKSCSVSARLLSTEKGVKVQTIQRAPASELPPELKKLLLALSPNTSSQPILTPQGFLVFWLCAKEDFNPQEPKEEDVRLMLLEQRLTMISQRELRNLHRGAVIDIKK
jgi:peptidyl-prolyl cis-trans isomerase SurA